MTDPQWELPGSFLRGSVPSEKTLHSHMQQTGRKIGLQAIRLFWILLCGHHYTVILEILLRYRDILSQILHQRITGILGKPFTVRKRMAGNRAIRGFFAKQLTGYMLVIPFLRIVSRCYFIDINVSIRLQALNTFYLGITGRFFWAWNYSFLFSAYILP